MPCVDEIVAHVEPDPNVDISDLRDDIAAAVAFIDARVLPILAAKEARIAELEAQVAPDEPIADAAERARAVALELRRRGIFAKDDGVDVAFPAFNEDKHRLMWATYAMLADAYAQRGPRAIADEIQREEAKRAQAWAGDEQ